MVDLERKVNDLEKVQNLLAKNQHMLARQNSDIITVLKRIADVLEQNNLIENKKDDIGVNSIYG